MQGIQQNQLGMALIPTAAGALSIHRLSCSALAYKLHSRASVTTNHLTTNHHATPENEDSAGANAVPGTTDGAAIGRRGVTVASAALAVLSLAVEDSKGESEQSLRLRILQDIGIGIGLCLGAYPRDAHSPCVSYQDFETVTLMCNPGSTFF